MRILFLSQVLPYPLDAGPKLRAYYTLRHLAREHDVTLLSFVRREDKRASVEHMKNYCEAVHTIPIYRSRLRDVRYLLQSLASKTPFLIARDRVRAMEHQTQQLLKLPGTSGRFEVVHADQLWMAPYALLARECTTVGGRGPAVVLDQHNAVFQIPRRLAAQTSNPLKRALFLQESRKLTVYEADACASVDHVVWVTQEDRLSLQAEVKHLLARTPVDVRRSSVIPICVDPEERQVISRPADAHRITFLGGLHWLPNATGITWFVQEVWPMIREQTPRAVLTVIGKSPPQALRSASQPRPHLDVTGYVTDPSVYVKETAVFIVPLHAGGGMRIKILDAWSWGLPVVTTRVGAEGIRVEDGENALLADTPAAFAQAVIRVFQDPQLAARLARGGRRTVEAHYNWRSVYSAWTSVYDGLVEDAR